MSKQNEKKCTTHTSSRWCAIFEQKRKYWSFLRVNHKWPHTSSLMDANSRDYELRRWPNNGAYKKFEFEFEFAWCGCEWHRESSASAFDWQFRWNIKCRAKITPINSRKIYDCIVAAPSTHTACPHHIESQSHKVSQAENCVDLWSWKHFGMEFGWNSFGIFGLFQYFFVRHRCRHRLSAPNRMNQLVLYFFIHFCQLLSQCIHKSQVLCGRNYLIIIMHIIIEWIAYWVPHRHTPYDDATTSCIYIQTMLPPNTRSSVHSVAHVRIRISQMVDSIFQRVFSVVVTCI